MAQPCFKVHYKSYAALARDYSKQLALNGLYILQAMELAPFSQVDIVIQTPDGKSVKLSAEVIQVAASHGFAVQFTSQSADSLKQLEKMCAEKIGSDSILENDPEFSTFDEENKPQKASNIVIDTQNLQAQIENMTVGELRHSALHGRKQMRLLLIKHRNKTIHPFIIQNPGLTLDEIEQFARMPGVNPDVLRSIAKHKDWARSTSVMRNLVKNPKTPMKEALMLLSKLPKSDIRAMAKSSNVRTAIQTAARKIINK